MYQCPHYEENTDVRIREKVALINKPPYNLHVGHIL